MKLKKRAPLAFLLITTSFCFACEKNKADINIPTHQKNDEEGLLLYKVREAKEAEKPVLVILMHGFGANEYDLLPLSQSFPENYIIVTPQAPFKIGSEHYQWYTNERSKEGNPEANIEELRSSIEKMQTLVKHLQSKYKVSAQRTFIGGFSQGANMSYKLGLKFPDLMNGIAVMSGTIFNSLKTEHDKTKASATSFFIAHGDRDERIPFSEAENSKKWMDSHHYQSEFHVYKGMGHSISDEEIKDLVSFVQQKVEKIK
ncbi:dienelactone hydrolase family protein [Epilithonimonas sp. JDS]|uniref:alpha/beta hydrolase n=1 Tax=Epilithonimonas sp. JDS TaxID=2902797 RepID=UPI001E4D3CDF|nr:dienelactone hydrolase family protein [Epilithonimonas sp. JDS]MCD9854501.1 dienelactone hydrolase family protein [Epilithonimonas sp. JDS]